ncbi:hypothetical protein THRCLA_03581 [Thraustotheca clavata]|uniref:PDZ domain-containing protein n=1 Tax=Thraustotheca clavata TaxID=74557 RepID=A0A1W0A1L7_9STRA|nr:hypothetical protein THRCLA_03581 [Thraustotheca clavata]
MDIIEVEFSERGDLGIRIGIDEEGKVAVRKIEPVKGPVESMYSELSRGDVLVSINGTSILPYSFTDVMGMIRKAKTKSEALELTFLPQQSMFESTESLVESWLTEQNDHLMDGEFQLVFPCLQSLGFSLVESFVMTTLFTLKHENVSKCIVKVNNDVVVGFPAGEVKLLLESNDASMYPKTLWLMEMPLKSFRLDNQYDVVTIPNHELMSHLQFKPIEMMLEAPMIDLSLENPSSPRGSRERREDGVATGQYVLAINGLPTLCVPNNQSSGDGSIGELTKALKLLESTTRSLLIRDLVLYQKEIHTNRPLSPWRRRDKETNVSIPLNDFSAMYDEENFVSKKQTYSEYLASIAKYPSTLTINPGRGIRQKWTQSRMLHVQIDQESLNVPLGLSFETDYSTKYTVFKGFERTCVSNTNQISIGDRILALNDQPTESMDTATIINFLMFSESKTRNIRVIKHRKSSSRIMQPFRRLWTLLAKNENLLEEEHLTQVNS